MLFYDCDLRFLHFAAARAYEHRHFINNPALARGAMYCMNSRCYTPQDSWEGTSPSHAYNAYRSQIFEAEAYTFDALLKERLDKISPPSYFETEVSPDQKRALQKARREAICRLFSPEDMLAIDDCIHDGSRRIADISDIVTEATNSPINSVRITLRDGQEQKFGYSLPTSCLLIGASNQNEIASPDFRRKYFNNALDFAIQSRAQVLDRFLNDSARAVGADPQEFTPRFIDDYLAKVEEEPTPNLDMIILGIDACVNTQERQAEDTAILIDRMIERANQMPRVKLRYVLNKRRTQLRRKIHGR